MQTLLQLRPLVQYNMHLRRATRSTGWPHLV